MMRIMSLTWTEEILWHHLSSIFILLLTLVFVAAVLRQRRPTGSAMAWLLIIVLVPYVGIPLYLVFGGRKFRRRMLSKSLLRRLAAESRFQSDRLEWLDDGGRAFNTFLREIENARDSIRIETFVLGNDGVGRALLQALIDKARAGVQVHLSLDDLLSFHAPHDLLREFVRAGGRLTKFMPVIHWPFRGRANLRNHRKIAIFDGERAIVGGMNLAEEYMGPRPLSSRWRDLSLFVEGEVADALDDIFRQDWEFAAKESLPRARREPLSADSRGDASVRVVPCGPDSPRDSVYDGILSALFRAEKRFWVATPYFIPDEVLSRALTLAAHRGVDVRIIVPQRSNHFLSDLAAASFLDDLSEEGVKVLRYQPGMLHAKVFLCDDDLAMVGSANLDMRSLFLNFEIVLFFSTEREIRSTEQWFEDTLRVSEARGEKVGRLRGLAESVLRLFAPIF